MWLPCSINEAMRTLLRGAFLGIDRGSVPRPPRAKRDKDDITLFVIPSRGGLIAMQFYQLRHGKQKPKRCQGCQKG